MPRIFLRVRRLFLRRLQAATGDHAFAQFDLRSVATDFYQTSTDGLAGLVLRDVVIDRGRLELPHADADTALFPIDIEDNSAHGLPLRQFFLWMLEPLFIGDVGNVDHTLDPLSQLDEGAELGQVGDRAFDSRADGELFSDGIPGIAERLLVAQGDATVGGVDLEDDCFDAFADSLKDRRVCARACSRRARRCG